MKKIELIKDCEKKIGIEYYELMYAQAFCSMLKDEIHNNVKIINALNDILFLIYKEMDKISEEEIEEGKEANK